MTSQVIGRALNSLVLISIMGEATNGNKSMHCRILVGMCCRDTGSTVSDLVLYCNSVVASLGSHDCLSLRQL
jgi:hypothetical protein